MNIIFMGTPEFSVPSLEALIKEYSVSAVITQPDRPRGRGMKLIPSAVKVCAEVNGIPVYQPETLKDGSIQYILDEYKPDLIAVVAYGNILPQYVREAPKFGCINVHASLLPKYRGASPIESAIINGDSESGVCTQHMEKGIDTGDVIISRKTEIGEYMTSGELHDVLSAMGAEILIETVKALENGTAARIPQDNDAAVYSKKLTKEMAKIDWNMSARRIINHVRGFFGAYTLFNGETFKLYDARMGEQTDEPAGMVCSLGEFIEVAAGDDITVKFYTIQITGGKAMAVADFLRGHQLNRGIRFE